MKKFYRCWAFFWDDDRAEIVFDDGFEFYLPEGGLLTGIKPEARAAFSSLVDDLVGMVVFDAITDEPLLGMLRDSDLPGRVFGFDLSCQDEELFFECANKWLSADSAGRKKLFDLLG